MFIKKDQDIPQITHLPNINMMEADYKNLPPK